jgi:hypothetical protein
MSFSCHKVAIQKKHKQLIVNKLERICDDGEKEVPKVLFNGWLYECAALRWV